jgi:hypothetical protein
VGAILIIKSPGRQPLYVAGAVMGDPTGPDLFDEIASAAEPRRPRKKTAKQTSMVLLGLALMPIAGIVTVIGFSVWVFGRNVLVGGPVFLAGVASCSMAYWIFRKGSSL